MVTTVGTGLPDGGIVDPVGGAVAVPTVDPTGGAIVVPTVDPTGGAIVVPTVDPIGVAIVVPCDTVGVSVGVAPV